MISIRIDNLSTGENETFYLGSASKTRKNKIECLNDKRAVKAHVSTAILKTRILIENGKLYTLIG